MAALGVVLLVTLVLLCCQAIIEGTKDAKGNGKEAP